jgi:hypothetical protein
VLIDTAGQSGASNRPDEIAVASSHGDTSGITNRLAAATAVASIAAIASAHALPAGSGITGSGSSTRTQTVNTARTASTRPANRRSQPRTVSAGRPTTQAIRRYPNLAALAASAVPITTAASARRSNPTTGNNTCVTPQPVHRDRRGRIHNGPSRPRSTRGRACPHPANEAEHPGHASRPNANRRSTPTSSTPTVITAPPSATTRPSRGTPARDNGRAVAYLNLITVPPNTISSNHPSKPPKPCSPSAPDDYPHILTSSAAEHPDER